MTPSTGAPETQHEKERSTGVTPRPSRIASLEELRLEIIFRHILRSDAQHASSSTWYLDLKPLLLRSDTLCLVAKLFWDHCTVFWPFQLCGIELGGITALTAVLLEGANRGFSVNAFVIRKEKKSYGTGRVLEGMPCELPVICIDDLHNSGRSIERVSRIVDSRGLKLAALFAIVDFESARGKQWRDAKQVPVISLFGLDALGLNLLVAKSAPALSRFFDLRWQTNLLRRKRPFHLAEMSKPALANGRLYVGCEDGTLHCLDLTSGAEVWKLSTRTTHKKGIWSSPAFVDGKVYFGGYDGNLYCVEGESGEVVWQRPVAEWIGSSPFYDRLRHRFYIGLEYALPGKKGALAAIDCSRGDAIWSVPTVAYQHGTPICDAEFNFVFFGSNDGYVACVQAESGEHVWSKQVGAAIRGAPALCPALDLVIFGTATGAIVACSTDTGHIVHRWQTNGNLANTPLVVNEQCFVSCSDGRLYQVDLKGGADAKVVDLGSRAFSSPALIQGSIFVGTASGAIGEIDPSSLEVMGGCQFVDPISSPVCFDEASSMFIAVGGSGGVFGFARRSVAPHDEPRHSINHGKKDELPSYAERETSTSVEPFRLVGTVPAVELVLVELEKNWDLFSVDQSRQRRIRVQRETESIPLRKAVRNGAMSINDIEDVEDTEWTARFPVLMHLLQTISSAECGTLQRAMVVKLPPACKVYPHVDAGQYYLGRNRYHLVVSTSGKGSMMKCGGSKVHMAKGEVWQIDNKNIHSSENRSSKDRVHVIFDIRQQSHRTL